MDEVTKTPCGSPHKTARLTRLHLWKQLSRTDDGVRIAISIDGGIPIDNELWSRIPLTTAFGASGCRWCMGYVRLVYLRCCWVTDEGGVVVVDARFLPFFRPAEGRCPFSEGVCS